MLVIGNHQRIGAISNAHVGRDFEAIAHAYFQCSEGITLQRDFRVFLGAGSTEKPHRFNLGSDDPPVLIECKSLHWTETGKVPSAKIRSCNEAMYYFHLAPAQYRKVLFMLRSDHPRGSETLAEYYARTCAHLMPPTVSIVEYDDRLETARSIKAAQQDAVTFRQEAVRAAEAYMASRTNACIELTRFWLEARHGCLVGEGVSVKVPSAHSDIDLVALHSLGEAFTLPTGATIGPRLIVETKDEHDWEPSGREFGQLLSTDVAKMDGGTFVPRGAKGVKFSMLREEHFDRAVSLFGNDDFDRLFVVHAIAPGVLSELDPLLSQRRIYWTTVPEIVRDLLGWYRGHEQQTTLRNTLVGDLFHLLVGFCGLELPDNRDRSRLP